MAQTDFTIADVLAWARTKPADERYNYGDTSNCALCQFLLETGRTAVPNVGGDWWVDASGKRRDIPEPIATTLLVCDRTFGDLAKHLEALCPATPVPQPDWAKLDAYMTDVDQLVREFSA